MDNTQIGTHQFDVNIRDVIDSLIEDSELTSQQAVEYFSVFTRRVSFAKTLAQIELFKKTISLPGSVVELGVYKGLSFMLFLKLADIYCHGDTLKRVIGFDTWSGFVDLHQNDGVPSTARDKVVGGFNAERFYEVLSKAIEVEQLDSQLPRFKRAELVKGDCRLTVPEYCENNPGLRISLLHLDLDLYEPTLTALEYLYPRVVPGGIVILDEYGMEGFPGETKAVEDYFGGSLPVIQKFPFISTPGGYFVKEPQRS